MRQTIIALLIVTLLFSWLPETATADGSDTTLTLKQAIDKALQLNTDLRQADLSLDAAKKVRDETWDKFNAALINTHIPGTDLYISLPTGADPEGAVYKTNYQWRLSEKNIDVAKDSVVMKVYQQYYKILGDISSINARQLEAERDDLRLTVAGVRFKVGMESRSGLSQYKAQAGSSKAALAGARQDLEKDYEEFNDLIGLPSGSSPELTDKINCNPLVVKDLDAEVREIVDTSPAVWTATEAEKLQEDIMGKFNSYDVDRVNLKKAGLGIDAARESMRKITRNFYYQAKSLEDSCQALNESLKAAEEALRAARISYDVGMATRLDVKVAEAAVETTRQKLADVISQHEILAMAFHKPWAYSAGSGNTSGSAGPESSGGSPSAGSR